MAIGWGASIVDEVATKIAATFYRAVAAGKPVDFALARARFDGKSAVRESMDPSWSLLYASTVDVRVLDETRPTTTRPAINVQQRLNGVAYAQPLIGRRRELQAVLPGLLGGAMRGIVVTGIGGSGKSSLATRLARILEARRDPQLKPIALTCKPNPALKPEDILTACGNEFIRCDYRELTNRTKDGTIPAKDRLNMLVSDLSDKNFILVIDNFERILDEEKRAIQEPSIAEFYVNLLNNLTGNSKLIVTSRYLPADVDPLPEGVVELRLGGTH